jgi:hypothetical protein
MKKTALHVAVSIAMCSALLVSTALEARPIRIDDGLAQGASGSWQNADFIEDSPFALGFGVAFLGGTANTVVVNGSGGISLFDGATLLGSITAASVTAPAGGSAWDETLGFNPIPNVDALAIVDAFRVVWQSGDDGSQSQIALFTASNGDSFIELNYWDGFNFDFGINISESDSPLGLITNAASVEQFNLRSHVGANQAGCLTSWGAFDDNTLPDPALPTPGTGCTGYFPNGDLTGATTLLPPAFQVANGGTAEQFNPVANYRYVVRYAAGTTTPPTSVPEPGTLTLLLSGLLLTAAARWRKSNRV